jgi:hypothetical protein
MFSLRYANLLRFEECSVIEKLHQHSIHFDIIRVLVGS